MLHGSPASQGDSHALQGVSSEDESFERRRRALLAQAGSILLNEEDPVQLSDTATRRLKSAYTAGTLTKTPNFKPPKRLEYLETDLRRAVLEHAIAPATQRRWDAMLACAREKCLPLLDITRPTLRQENIKVAVRVFRTFVPESRLCARKWIPRAFILLALLRRYKVLNQASSSSTRDGRNPAWLPRSEGGTDLFEEIFMSRGHLLDEVDLDPDDPDDLFDVLRPQPPPGDRQPPRESDRRKDKQARRRVRVVDSDEGVTEPSADACRMEDFEPDWNPSPPRGSEHPRMPGRGEVYEDRREEDDGASFHREDGPSTPTRAAADVSLRAAGGTARPTPDSSPEDASTVVSFNISAATRTYIEAWSEHVGAQADEEEEARSGSSVGRVGSARSSSTLYTSRETDAAEDDLLEGARSMGLEGGPGRMLNELGATSGGTQGRILGTDPLIARPASRATAVREEEVFRWVDPDTGEPTTTFVPFPRGWIERLIKKGKHEGPPPSREPCPLFRSLGEAMRGGGRAPLHGPGPTRGDSPPIGPLTRLKGERLRRAMDEIFEAPRSALLSKVKARPSHS